MSQRILTTVLAAALGSAGALASADAAEVGVRSIRVEAGHRAKGVETLIWYPSAPGGVVEQVGGDALFVGTSAQRDAPLAPGRFPAVLISHGSGGNAANLAWLATALAARGFIVAAPNHPGTTSRDSLPSETVKIWERPADMSAVLTALLGAPEFGSAIDSNRVGLAGFSLGGHTALATAGARVDADKFAAFCDIQKQGVSECAWLQRGGVDWHKLDNARFNQSNHDPRFKSVVAIDPGFAPAFTDNSLAALTVPALLINLGRKGTVPDAVDAGGVAARVTGANVHYVTGAMHLSFLGQCRPNGREILKAAGEEDPVCDDGGTRTRADIHDELKALVGDFFAQRLTH